MAIDDRLEKIKSYIDTAETRAWIEDLIEEIELDAKGVQELEKSNEKVTQLLKQVNYGEHPLFDAIAGIMLAYDKKTKERLDMLKGEWYFLDRLLFLRHNGEMEYFAYLMIYAFLESPTVSMILEDFHQGDKNWWNAKCELEEIRDAAYDRVWITYGFEGLHRSCHDSFCWQGTEYNELRDMICEINLDEKVIAGVILNTFKTIHDKYNVYHLTLEDGLLSELDKMLKQNKMYYVDHELGIEKITPWYEKPRYKNAW